MTAYNNMDAAVAGLKYGLDSQTESWNAKEAISHGDSVFGYAGDDKSAWLFHLDTSTTVFDGDFVASNSIVATVNGTAVDAVVFDTNQATTMTALAAQIEADIEGATATLTDETGDNRTIAIFIEGTDVVVSWSVTGGGSQADNTVTQSSAQVFVGVAQKTAGEFSSSQSKLDGTEINAAVNYEAGDAVNVMVVGYIYVNAIGAVNANSAAYILKSGSNKGKWTATSSDNYDTKARFRNTLAATGLALVELRGQN
jgi:hypothetical protein